MGVPAHDERDFLFANEHGLAIVKVVESPEDSEEVEEGDGVLVNSQQFTGMTVEEAKKEIVSYAEKQGFGGLMSQYKLRDWLISRQRYWGTPIPVLYCDKCGVSLNRTLKYYLRHEFRSNTLAFFDSVFQPLNKLGFRHY